MTETDQHMESIEARLARIEARLDTFATKDDLRYFATREDVANVRADIASMGADLRREINSLMRFLITWATGLGVSLVAASFLIARYL